MTVDSDQRMVEEFIAGRDVPEIAKRYNVPEAYVDRVIEDAQAAKPKRWDFSLYRWPNRLFYSLLAGWIINISAGINTLGTVVAVVLFVLTTAIVTVRRR